jgi:hypothetical protein
MDLFEAENADLIAEKKVTAERLITAEHDLRELAVDEFKATGDKEPAAGVKIRIMKKLVYDELEVE